METIKICPDCRKPLAPGAPDGLCPECLVKAGFTTDVEIGPETHEPSGLKPPAAPSPEAIAAHFPNLEILELLGQGGMAAVYKARQPHLNRLIALKILTSGREQDSAFADRFTREAQTLARLNHPHIVTLYDFGKVDGLFYLCMEYVDGVSLRQLMQSKKLSPEEALAIVPKICDALQYAHEHGVVHRDIKPENVLLNQEGRVKIADFGIAKMVDAGAVQPAITRDEQVIGTPHYMAPEQVEKPRLVDHRADIYSLGVVFYEMLTGELPLGKFAPPSQRAPVDGRLDEVVLHALEKDPERRYQQARQVKTDVETISAAPTPAAAGCSKTVSQPGFPLGPWNWVDTARWSARLLGASLLVYFALIVGRFLLGVGPPPLALEPGGTLLNYAALALMAVGLATGWTRDGTAALLTALGWALWHSSNGSLAWNVVHLVALVAALHTFCWWAGQGQRTWVVAMAGGGLGVLLACGILFLPTNVCLSGAVLDAVTLHPIPDAELLVSSPPVVPDTSRSPAAARTLSDGHYSLRLGWYTPGKQVRITAPGHTPLQMPLGSKPLASRRIRRDFALTPLATARPGTSPSLEHLLRDPWWGQEASEKIAAQYSDESLSRFSDANSLARLGMALYDTQRFEEALKVFCRLEQVGDQGEALVWQGHMLDLLGQRTQAVEAYRKALAAGVETRHDQYRLVLNKAYVERRLATPFTWLENKNAWPAPSPDYARALAVIRAMSGPSEALERAYGKDDLELIAKLTANILESVSTYNALVRGTDLEVPQSAIDLLTLSLEAARAGNLERAMTFFNSLEATIDPDFVTRLETRAGQAEGGSPGAAAQTNAIPR
jgi:tRNA A-37 threonylcarbamoyl transferase component Bud32/tetratricopeptide (TPR) repeat protein